MALFGRSKDDPSQAASAETEPERLPNPPETEDTVARSVQEHRDLLLSRVPSLKPFGMGLLDAHGLTLCETIVADLDLPTFTSATVDGWAVRGSNLVGASSLRPVVLPVVDTIEPGGFRGAPLTPGTVVRVAAGAPVPEGADAVVPLEEGVDLGEERVEFQTEAVFKQNLVLAGSRVADGDTLARSGATLDARMIGLLAEVGLDKVLTRPRPRVVVLSLGTDLVAPGLPLTRLTQTYDAGTALIAAAVRAEGAQVFPAGIVADDAKSVRRALEDQLLRADLLIMLAEPSDALVSVLGAMGSTDVGEVAMNPGGRQVFALVGEDKTPVLVLPSKVVPAYISYQAFGRPLIRRLAGLDPLVRRTVPRPTTRALDADPDRTEFRLAELSHRGVTPLPVADDLGAAELARAKAIVVIPAGAGGIPAHADVICWLLDEQP